MREKATVGDLMDIVPPVILIGGAYLLYQKFFAGGSTTVNNTATDKSAAAAAAADTAAANAAGIKQILSNNTLNGYATDLQNAISNFDGSDLAMSDIVNIADQVDNQADWNQLVNLFGTRQFNSSLNFYSWCNLLGYSCTSMDLPSALRLVLDSHHKDDLNSYFSDQGINASI